MNPNNPQHLMGSYPPHYFHVNPASLNWQWNQAMPGPSTLRGNFIHVNPAFFQTNVAPPPELLNPKRIIVNPKFFPHVQPERNTGTSSASHEVKNVEIIPAVLRDQAPNLNRVVIQEETKEKKQHIMALNSHNSQPIAQHHMKPSPIRPISERRKLTKMDFTNQPMRSKYKWRKMESPLKAIATKHAYKLVRKSVVKSPKLASLSTHRAQYHASRLLTPPKFTSTPTETQPPINSRFKLDNRVTKNKKKATKSSSPRVSLPKVIQNKYRLIRNKCWKSKNLTLTKSGINRSIINHRSVVSRSVVNRSFTNFKSPVCRPMAHHSSRLQRLAVVIKPNKSIKKTKTTKSKTRKRYYDDEAKAKPDDEVLDDVDVEIAEKPSGPKNRTPIGALPSFITL